MKKSFLFLILFSTMLFTGCSSTKMEDLSIIETQTQVQTEVSSISTQVSKGNSINTESLLDLEIVKDKGEEEKSFEDYNYTANASDDRFYFENSFEVGKLYVKIIGTTNEFIDYMVISKEGELFYYQDSWDDFALFLVSNEIPMFDNPLEIDEVIYWNNKELPEGYIDGDYKDITMEEDTLDETSILEESTIEEETIVIEEETIIEEETTKEEVVEESSIAEEVVQPKKYNDIISKNTYFSEEFFADGSKVIIHSNIDCKILDDSMISIIEIEKYDAEFNNLINSTMVFEHCDKCVK